MDLEETTRAHKARLAIRTFKIVADALFLRGHYALGGKSGQALEDALRTLSPEIYGTMNDPKSIELKGLEYILDRLPRGIEECHRIVLTAREDLDGTSFEKIQPPNRRRISYRVSENEMCFVITRGSSEIYDILTHMTFLYIEAKKLHERMRDDSGNPTKDWKELDKAVGLGGDLSSEDLDRAIWSLSVLLGRTLKLQIARSRSLPLRSAPKPTIFSSYFHSLVGLPLSSLRRSCSFFASM